MTIFILEMHSVLTIDIRLSNIEQKLLYSHLQTSSDLKLYYEKILESNNIDDITRLDRPITQNDIQRGDFEHKCFSSADDLLNAFNIQPNSSLSNTDIKRLSPALINVKFNDGCRKSEGRVTWKNMLIGILTVTLINCSALCGAIILPFRKKPAFKWILTGFIGLAVGTLTGSGIFHLIPMIICTHTHGDDEVLTESNNCHVDSTPSSLIDSKRISINSAVKVRVLLIYTYD
ncbi:unnamed protein product [Adineta steineri]|uniref:Uncharacterized protein n=1 Tax=Adineta steineri TaxID=433720 RepID=A0A814XIC8_9BILA|nr:unnamed protein product [Adineta steineri]